MRRSVVNEADFEALLDACEAPLKPLVTVALETGMRKGEILNLRWESVDLATGFIRLNPQDTKANDARNIPLTEKLKALFSGMPRGLPFTAVFRNPATGEPWKDIKRIWGRAVAQYGHPNLVFHDLRRSFVTRARRRGIPEALIMRMSGHKTRAVFERYNVVDEGDLVRAALHLSRNFGEDLDEVSKNGVQKVQGAIG